jgi:hypothetical protein
MAADLGHPGRVGSSGASAFQANVVEVIGRQGGGQGVEHHDARLGHRVVVDIQLRAAFLGGMATNRIIASVPSRRHDPTGAALQAIVLDLIAMDPDDRPDSAGDVARRLDAI